ncbi:MAG: N-acetyltransferase [Thermodesulfobacteriota bacterium]
MSPAVKSVDISVRKARVGDVKAIFALVQESAGKDEMLARSIQEIYAGLRDFSIAWCGEKIAGIVALHIWDEDLAEIRSLAVDRSFRGMGAGSSLIETSLSEASLLGIKRVFALTYALGFFEKMGFTEVDKTLLPQKIWGDCIECRKFPGCDETAVMLDLDSTAETAVGEL